MTIDDINKVQNSNEETPTAAIIETKETAGYKDDTLEPTSDGIDTRPINKDNFCDYYD